MRRTQFLCPAAIDRLTAGEFKDQNTPGLSIEVLSTGKKVWKYKRRVSGGGPLVRLSLGPFQCLARRAERPLRAWLRKLDPNLPLRQHDARLIVLAAQDIEPGADGDDIDARGADPPRRRL